MLCNFTAGGKKSSYVLLLTLFIPVIQHTRSFNHSIYSMKSFKLPLIPSTWSLRAHNSLLRIPLNKPIRTNNIQILLLRPISNTMSHLARSPMLAFIRRCQVRGVALQDHEHIAVIACLWWWARWFVYSKVRRPYGGERD